MKYTKEHYKFMEWLSRGVLADNLTDYDLEILRYLDDEKIAEPRAYIQDGLWVLSQKGKAMLQTHQDELQTAEHIVAQSVQPKVNQEQYPGDKLKKRKINWGKVFTEVISVVGLISSVVAIIEFLFGILG